MDKSNEQLEEKWRDQIEGKDRTVLDSKKIRVLIVDDDPFVCASLETILNAEEDIDISGVGHSCDEALQLFAESEPDILLMDIQMPEKSGLECGRRILKECPQARIVFLTTFSDDDYIVAALRMGAKGYLIKHDVATIVPSLRLVMSGQSVLGDEVLGKMDSLIRSNEKSSGNTSGKTSLSAWGKASPKIKQDLAKLSEREREIIELVAQGLDNRDIAASIYISEGTVRNHISAILQKLSLKNRTQLAILYYRER